MCRRETPVKREHNNLTTRERSKTPTRTPIFHFTPELNGKKNLQWFCMEANMIRVEGQKRLKRRFDQHTLSLSNSCKTLYIRA